MPDLTEWPAVGASELTARKDAANGYAGLDAGAKLKTGELPLAVVNDAAAPAGKASFDYSVTRAASLNPMWAEYGAKGDGVTDDTAALQACLNTIKNAGQGKMFIPPGLYRITAPLIAGSHMTIEGPSAGGFSPLIQYAGAAAMDLLQFPSQSAHFAVRDLGFKINGNYGNANKCLHLIDPVYFDLDTISCYVSVLGTATGATGVLVEAQTANLTPPRGFGRLANILLTSGGVVGLAGSRGVEIRGIPGGSLSDISLEGWADLEECEIGLFLNTNITNVTSGPGWLGLGNTTNVKMVGAQNCVLIKPHLVNTLGEHINIDGTSYDNAILFPTFSAPNAFGTDNGVRTRIDTTTVSKVPHLQGGGPTPNYGPGGGAGAAGVATGVGSDLAGTITITPGGAGIVPGFFGTINFVNVFPVAPRAVLLTPGSAAAAALNPWINTSAGHATTTQFTFSVANAPSAGVAYPFNYMVIA